MNELEKLLEIFCNGRNVTPNQIKGKSRKVQIVLYRHAFTVLAHSQGFSPSTIMRFLKRNRSSFYNSLDNHRNLLFDKRYRKVLKTETC